MLEIVQGNTVFLDLLRDGKKTQEGPQLPNLIGAVDIDIIKQIKKTRLTPCLTNFQLPEVAEPSSSLNARWCLKIEVHGNKKNKNHRSKYYC